MVLLAGGSCLANMLKEIVICNLGVFIFYQLWLLYLFIASFEVLWEVEKDKQKGIIHGYHLLTTAY